ncbi:MAG: hypothetical protein VKM97_07150 [Cyanobacteriota bacterium]|nr:hypothetical protein [Cyanobacteriota bacterium]
MEREQGGGVLSDMFTSMTMNSIHVLSDQAAEILSGGYYCKPPTYPCMPKIHIPKVELPKFCLPMIHLPKIDIKWGCYSAHHVAKPC